MIEVMLVTNDGSGIPRKIPVVNGTTLEKFLEVSFGRDLDDFTIRVRANGMTVEAHLDYVLQDGDRVSLAPKKIEGDAGKGPGTNEEQIASLRTKMSTDNVTIAERLAADTDPNVLTLAYKLKRVQMSRDKLPKTVSKLLSGLSKEDAELVRSKLTKRS
jgi:hypothetical protein